MQDSKLNQTQPKPTNPKTKARKEEKVRWMKYHFRQNRFVCWIWFGLFAGRKGRGNGSIACISNGIIGMANAWQYQLAWA
jgi:hypothetical protein